jgi:hypothetical protein
VYREINYRISSAALAIGADELVANRRLEVAQAVLARNFLRVIFNLLKA